MLQSLTFPCNLSLQFPISSNSHPYRSSIMRCRTGAAAVQSFAALVAARKPASFYEVLRVKQTASSVEIKAAYRSLAKRYHPDAAPSAESDARDFILIHNAYETLSDPTARALYDLSLGFVRERRSSFECYTYSVGRRPTRRWETDQCW